MKFLELTGYGNQHKHLISLRSIADIEFTKNYTHISLNNGNAVNVLESEKEITDMINYQRGGIINKEYIDNLNAQIEAYEEIMDDNLPF
jgi:hypothetical protein